MRRARLLTLPISALVVFYLLAPTLLALYLSLTTWAPAVPLLEGRFVGLDNYLRILSDTRFLGALWNSTVLTAVGLTLQFAIGLGLALLLVQMPRRGKGLIVAILISPTFLVPVVTGFTFYTLFYGQGAVDQLLSTLLFQPIRTPWRSDPTIALWPIIIADTWQWSPMVFLVLYIALLNIPKEYYGAAALLGASRWHVLWYIRFPLIAPFVYTVMLVRGLHLFELFDLPLVMTGGAPGTATETTSLYFYYIGIQSANFSYVSAGAFLIFAGVIVVTLLTSRRVLGAGRLGRAP